MAKGGGRKVGRNKVKCKRYETENRRVKNKAKKVKRLELHLEKCKMRKELKKEAIHA